MKILERWLRGMIREELEVQTQNRELVKLVLSKLPKRSTYVKFVPVEGQGQYWFDVTWPYGDFAVRQGGKLGIFDYEDERLYRGFFDPLIRKLQTVLPPGVAVVGRGKNLVVVEG